MLCGTPQKIYSIEVPCICIGDCEMEVSLSGKNLGVLIDNYLSMEDHVYALIKSISFGLKNIQKMKRYIDSSSLKTIVASPVLSRFDYYNSLLAGLPDSLSAKLQKL